MRFEGLPVNDDIVYWDRVVMHGKVVKVDSQGPQGFANFTPLCDRYFKSYNFGSREWNGIAYLISETVEKIRSGIRSIALFSPCSSSYGEKRNQ